MISTILNPIKPKALHEQMFVKRSKLSRHSSTTLIPIGRLQTPKKIGVYKPGQLFLNKLFGYRGVILFPWGASVFDLDKSLDKTSGKQSSEEIQERVENHMDLTLSISYPVLIDSRDMPFITSQMATLTQKEMAPFIEDNVKRVFTIPGLDYVAHKDILPYSSNERDFHMRHPLFNYFFERQENQTFRSDDLQHKEKPSLILLRKKCVPWLKLSGIYQKTTYHIRITVIPFYLGTSLDYLSTKEKLPVYWKWMYYVKIENLGGVAVKVTTASWKVSTFPGKVRAVDRKNWIGHEPILDYSSPAYQYIGNVSLQIPSAQMKGRLSVKRNDGSIFFCNAPSFTLKSNGESVPTYV